MGLDLALKGGAAALGLVAGLLGGWDALLQILLILMALDEATGMAGAATRGELSARALLAGSFRKLGVLCAVALAVTLDRLLGNAAALRSIACVYYIAMEGLSIAENLGGLGVPLPPALVKALARLKQESGA